MGAAIEVRDIHHIVRVSAARPSASAGRVGRDVLDHRPLVVIHIEVVRRREGRDHRGEARRLGLAVRAVPLAA
jgi:hypothetical protein